ncbi:MAG: hypothetical protein JO249_12215 [Acidobacteria bacterium]|nr:hypothetical protein [Acidobacteriota bacterium]
MISSLFFVGKYLGTRERCQRNVAATLNDFAGGVRIVFAKPWNLRYDSTVH